MAANLVEKLQEAIKACEEIPVKELNAQKQQIMEQFKELQKAVFEIVDEKTIILSALKWKKVEKKVSGEFDSLLEAEAKKIALQYGYLWETVYEILEVKNKYDHESDCIESHLLCNSVYMFEYWTLE